MNAETLDLDSEFNPTEDDPTPTALDALIHRARALVSVDGPDVVTSTESAVWRAVEELADARWIEAATEERRREIAQGFVGMLRRADDRDLEVDVAILRDLIDRRPELNAVALRPGQAVHAHALEHVLTVLAECGLPAKEVQ